MKTLLLTDPLPAAAFADAIAALAPELNLLSYRADIGNAELADVDVVLGWRLPPGVAPRLPKLKWVCSVAAGVEKLLPPDLPAHVAVSRIVDNEQAEGIAQFVVMMALRHARALPRYEAQQQSRQWVRHPVAAVRSRVTVLGMGATGSVIAQLLRGVGFEVQGWNRRSRTENVNDLDSLLRGSAIVVCALPLTPATQGLLNARTLALLPQGGYLINIARGGHVVEADLIAAVRSGQLAGAALDVQQHEPMPADDPLWTVPGITITPHIAAQSSMTTIATQFVEGMRALQRGERLPRLVDRSAGY